jgi:hypothetical protein
MSQKIIINGEVWGILSEVMDMDMDMDMAKIY